MNDLWINDLLSSYPPLDKICTFTLLDHLSVNSSVEKFTYSHRISRNMTPL